MDPRNCRPARDFGGIWRSATWGHQRNEGSFLGCKFLLSLINNWQIILILFSLQLRNPIKIYFKKSHYLLSCLIENCRLTVCHTQSYTILQHTIICSLHLFFQVGGNKMFKMLYDSNFTYDSSMPVYENRPPSWPYTLDYKIFHDCMIPPCPTRSYPGKFEHKNHLEKRNNSFISWVTLRAC